MEDYCVWLWWDTSVLLFSPLKYNGYGAQVPSEAAANSCYGDAIPAGVGNPRVNYAADSNYPAGVDQQNYDAYKGGSWESW